MYKGIGFGIIVEPLDLGTEVMRVRLNSVDAAVNLADHHGQHLALLPGQGGGREHGGAVHFH